MKFLNLILATIFIVSLLFSCGSSHHHHRTHHRHLTKHKKCSGNGSWYGHRNLGAIDNLQKDNKEFYSLNSTTKEAENM